MPSSPPNKISAFDLDHTLLNANSSYKFGKYLYKQKKFSLLTMISLAGYYWMHKVGWLSMPKMQTKAFKKLFKGLSYCSITSLLAPFLDRYFNEMLYAPAVSKLQEAQERGEYTIILSSSPDFLVKAIAERFKVDEWQATVYEVDEANCFCTLSKFMEGEDKAQYLHQLAQRLNIPKAQITAYSDSILDLAFLQSSGVPIAVNPDRLLKKFFKKNNWQILSFKPL